MTPQPNKRMRLGTKSCTECRRRKVKCTVEEGRDRCRQCAMHSLVCRSQIRAPETDDERFQADDGSRGRSAHAGSRVGASQNVGNRAVGSAETISSGSLHLTPSCQGEEEDGGTFTAAPLVGYFKKTLNTETAPPSSPRRTARPDPCVVEAVTSLLPNRPTLVNILKCTQDFWPIWPLARIATSTSSAGTAATTTTPDDDDDDDDDDGFPDTVASALAFIDKSLASPDLGVVSRCLIWVCLCLQELPKGFADALTGEPLRPQPAIHRCVAEVQRFYQAGSSSSPACSLAFVEALALAYELFIFMGRPGRAWKSTRAGIDNALLLGLHRRGQGRQKQPKQPKQRWRRGRNVWNALWVQDRHLSLFLGLPYTVPEHLTSSDDDGSTRCGTRENEDDDGGDRKEPLEKRILRRIAIISGHISDRDHAGQDSPYSATARIVEELDDLKAGIPREWGSPEDDGRCGSFAQAFVHRAIRLFCVVTEQMVHLPYACMADRDKRYEYNRSAAFAAAEGVIRAYQSLRALQRSSGSSHDDDEDDDGGSDHRRRRAPMSCDFLDFLAFNAAAVLAADLLSTREEDAKPYRDAAEECRLWTLIMDLAGGMRRLADVLDCAAAEQSAEALEHLYDARRGRYAGPGDYEVRIPYFGRMRISVAGSKPETGDSVDGGGGGGGNDDDGGDVCCFKNVVEMESNAFGFRVPNVYQTEAEMTVDWAAGFGVDLDGYDWQGVFEFEGFTGCA